MNLNIEYSKALDFGHLDDINAARDKLSELTTLLNKVIVIRQKCKIDIIICCASYPEAKLHKLSWDNKLVSLSSKHRELVELWQEADTAYRQIKNKQDQVMEDLLSLKKMIDVTPR